MPSPLIDANDLKKLLDTSNIAIIDAGGSPQSFNRYMEKHIEGAQYVDLDKQLSKVPENAKDGGRHPLPPINEFCTLLGDLGIDPQTTVIVYDDKGGVNAASRFWWMMKALGHKNLFVLNGGLAAAEIAGIRTTSNPHVEKNLKNVYPTTKWDLPMVDIEEIEKFRSNADYKVIDVRSSERFDGKAEPIDLIAGHIPGAINVPLENNLNTDGKFRDPKELHKYYSDILGNTSVKNTAIHCGSGVTACHTILSLEHAGIGIPNLYVGSWSEWSRNNKPIGTN
ncbi:sulfurtransferase [Aegicerativicinus sediminis]|uniref:sulfurtransferase n=1 Tax=Aegicerativicinus sediminis TaxID=2893202 RepID=UPI001E4FDA9B|nr:sulfurtransferase [Aegicerativicinus sediminis]